MKFLTSGLSRFCSCASVVTLVLMLGLVSQASSQSAYTFDAASVTAGTATDSWNAGTYWTGGGGTPYLGTGSNATTLNFSGSFNDTAGATTLNSVNDIATGLTVGTNADVYLLNALSLAATRTGTNAAAVNLSGNALDFSGANPTISLNAGAGVIFTVADNLILSADTIVSGTGGSGAYNFTGALSGTGDLSFSPTATMTVVLGSTGAASSPNAAYAYQGDITVGNGTNSMTLQLGATKVGTTSLPLGNGNLFITGGLVLNAHAGIDVEGSSLAVSSLTGSGTISKGSASGSVFGVVVNYVGGTTDTFGGTFAATLGPTSLALAGPGAFTLSNAAAGTPSTAVFTNLGTGTLTVQTIAGGLNQAGLGTTIVTSNVSGTSVGGSGTNLPMFLQGGTFWIQPASGATGVVTLTGQAGSNNQIRYSGAGTIKLDRNGNAGLIYRSGSAGNAGDLARGNKATLFIAPTDGFSGLGTTEQFQVLGTLSGMGGNNIWNPGVAILDPTGNIDFATYITSGGAIATSATAGSASDVGFMALSTAATGAYSSLFTNYLTSLGSATSASVVELAGNQGTISLGGAASAYALRIDGGTTLNLGANTLTMGSGSGQTAIILNGGTIGSTAGTLAFGSDAEAIIYTGAAGGTIGAKMSTSGTTTSLTKSGLGTLFLTGTTYNSLGTSGSNVFTVDQGAVDVGTLMGATNSTTSGALPALQLILTSGGVLQGNGSFNRGIATSGAANYSLILTSGGFAARGGDFTVNLGGSSATETWGSPNFLTDTVSTVGNVTAVGTLIFGSDTSNGQVDFQNAIALGATNDDYYREVYVTPGLGGSSAKLSGAIGDTAGSVGGHGFLKTGNGTLLLSGANSYAGFTNVGAGSLLIAGTTTGQGNFTVIPLAQAGALLGGTGTIGLAAGQTLTLSGVSATQRAYLAPGNNSLNVNAAGTAALVNNGITFTNGSPALMNAATAGGTGPLGVGTLTVNGNVVVNPFSELVFVISGDLASKLAINGNLTLGGANTALALDDLGGAHSLSRYTLITYTGSLIGTLGEVDLPAGYTLDYSTAGQIDVDFSAVPEPRMLGLELAGLLGVFLGLRRCRARAVPAF